MKSLTQKILESWKNTEGNVHSTEALLSWIQNLNETTFVRVQECALTEGGFWYYDREAGRITNQKKSFFDIRGIRRTASSGEVTEQPIIHQPEIGYLGIICKEIDGVLNFLMQAKIEPGNVNCVQISPTIQATKSNFTRVHGGNLPAYFDYFKNAGRYRVIYDQIQSEQAARFYKKRNRNIMILVEDEIEILPSFRFMTLGQIKKLMEVDNLVNMDTRTVLSGIPLLSGAAEEKERKKFESLFNDHALYASLYEADPQRELAFVYPKINDFKMFTPSRTEEVPLESLTDWTVSARGITAQKPADFSVRFYDIEIAGREVRRWTQPLFKATGMATFGLLVKEAEGAYRFLVKLTDEIGSFDQAELGPTVLWESTHDEKNMDAVEKLFAERRATGEGVMIHTLLSEEGGRFYHEQNHNVIIKIDEADLSGALPPEYVWLSLSTLNYLVEVNNCLDIQLRNLLSLLKI